MSWAQEEWKDGLPNIAISKVTELEDECERLIKDKKALQFQVDTLQSSLERSRAAEEEANKLRKDAERNLASFMSELDETTAALERSLIGSKEKDITILNLSNEVTKCKREKEFEKEKRFEVERANGKLEQELCNKEIRFEEVSKQLQEFLKLDNARRNVEDLEKKGLEKDDFEFKCNKDQRLSEETFLIEDGRNLESQASWETEKDLEDLDIDELKNQVELLQKKLISKDTEMQGLLDKFEELDSLLGCSTSKESVSIKDGNSQSSSKSNLDDITPAGDSLEIARRISVVKTHIYELKQENDYLRAAVGDQMRKNSREGVSEYAVESLQESLTQLNEQLEISEKARSDITVQLQDEREMYIISEDVLKKQVRDLKAEMEKNKKQWQEEREGFLENERCMKNELRRLKYGSNTSVNADKLLRGSSSRIGSLEAEIKSLNETIAKLQNRNGILEQAKAELRENEVENKSSHSSRMQIEELYCELDEVNKILADERSARKKLEADNLEFKKKERLYENAIAASMEGDERNVMSSFLKKRGERWTEDVVELRKKVDELERKNRELANALDRRDCSVEALKQGYENKLREEQLKKGGKNFATPDRSAGSSEVVSRSSSYTTPLSRISSLNTSESDLSSRKSRNELITHLKTKMAAAENDKAEQAKASNLKIQALEEEITFLKQHIKGISDVKKNGIPNTVITTPNKSISMKKSREIQTVSSANRREKHNVKLNGDKLNSIDELKELVKEFQCESSELQEIIEESKDAIFELKKALQGNDGLFLVDSANMEEIKKLASKTRCELDETDSVSQQRPKVLSQEGGDITPEKQSYILSRLSLTDIDVESVLSKLRVAVSQLETRLETVHTEKEEAEAKIQELNNTFSKTASGSDLSAKSNDDISAKTGSKNELQSSRSAVMDIARERDAIITDGTIDDIAHKENLRPRDENSFQHGVRCKLLWQQLCDAKASISRNEREMAWQKKLHEKELAEIQEKEKVAKDELVQKIDQEEIEKKDQTIKRLESQLLDERQSSIVLHDEIEGYRVQLDESEGKNSKLVEKLEETRALLFKHHKSNENKLDNLTNFVQEELIQQVKNAIDFDYRRCEYARPSPSEQRYLRNSGSKQSSHNASFHSPEEHLHADIAAKKSRSRRNKALDAQRSTASRAYLLIDEIEGIKGQMSCVQDNTKSLLGCIEQLHREKCKLQDECKHLLKRIDEKEEELRAYHGNMELEKQRMNDVEAEYRAELDALKAEQIEVFQEFRQMCEAVKHKDIELLNKSKQMKLLAAEWKEKEATLSNQIENLEKENKGVWTENNELRVEVERTKNIKDEYTKKMKNSEDNLNKLYLKLQRVDSIFFECKQKGLYK